MTDANRAVKRFLAAYRDAGLLDLDDAALDRASHTQWAHAVVRDLVAGALELGPEWPS